ncbi:MAG: glycosyltransferase family 4 protein [Cyanobacteria bacterium REEB444]|nr:glycosyltransferase family 4 protein [Cyanobacteria bacterium REEB444]
MFNLGISLVSFSVSYGLVGFLRQFWQHHFLDLPNERSSHSLPTPRHGGLGFILSFVLTLGIVSLFDSTVLVPFPSTLWLSLVPLIAIGLMDDFLEVPALVRYLVQLLSASLIVMQCGVFPQPWLEPLGTPASAFLGVGMTVIGITALINFYNFMDGMDGLVGSVTAIQLTFFAIWSDQPILGFAVASILGFLCWNWSPAKIFMGDCGSTTLGCVMAIAVLKQPNPIHNGLASLSILLPLVGDAIYTLIRRQINHENLLKAHRTHVYQRLHHQAGWSHSQVSLVYGVLTVVSAINLYQFKVFGSFLTLVMNGGLVIWVEWYLNETLKKKKITEL